MALPSERWRPVEVTRPSFSVRSGRSPKGHTCTGGTAILSGGPMLQVERAPAIATTLFRGIEFHGPTCLNAYILEGLAVLEAVSAPDAQQVCQDLRELIAALRVARGEFAGAGFV